LQVKTFTWLMEDGLPQILAGSNPSLIAVAARVLQGVVGEKCGTGYATLWSPQAALFGGCLPKTNAQDNRLPKSEATRLT